MNNHAQRASSSFVQNGSALATTAPGLASQTAARMGKKLKANKDFPFLPLSTKKRLTDINFVVLTFRIERLRRARFFFNAPLRITAQYCREAAEAPPANRRSSTLTTRASRL
ncbi:hypothetical protein MTO96_047119 [Rhipicephalus appendiculatus]